MPPIRGKAHSITAPKHIQTKTNVNKKSNIPFHYTTRNKKPKYRSYPRLRTVPLEG